MSNQIMAVIGITGGLMCAVADLLLDLKGPDNKKLGKLKVIDSKWAEMPEWRFVASIIIAMFAVPMYTLGFYALMNRLPENYTTLGNIMKFSMTVGAMGGFMIHTFLCSMPGVYRDIMNKNNDFDLAETVINDFFRRIYIPFFTLYILLVIVSSIAVMVMIGARILPLPIWCVLLNPLVIQVLGLLFRATKLDIFIDAPSCCAASIGLASFGLIALL